MQCKPLIPPEHGKLYPLSCERQNFPVKQKCSINCQPGFTLQGTFTYKCNNNLSWTPEFNSSCIPGEIRPVISCPDDINITLPIGMSSLNITVPSPITNMDTFNIKPEWVVIGQSVEFPAGKTNIIFTANGPRNTTDHCVTTVEVIDDEPPTFHECPESFHIELNKDTIVTWKEPAVTDNVGIQSLTQTLKPNTSLTSGIHIAHYIAKDFNGNIDECYFEINVTRPLCSDLADPLHGESNCMDWLPGKLCTVTCDPGYTNNASEILYYRCDESGKWNPSSIVPDCYLE